MHLGHASTRIILRTARNAKRRIDEKDVVKVISQCGCDQELHKSSQHATISPHRSPWAGHTVGMDTWYPIVNSGKKHPFIVIVDRFSRMTVSGMIPDETVQSALEFLSHRWISIFGRPRRLLTDNGANFKGEVFAAFVGVWNITHVCSPAYSAYQGGIFERTVGMLKSGVQAILKHDPSIQWADAVSQAVTGRNLSPLLECGLAPLTIMTGRRNIIDFSTEHDFSAEEDAADSIHIEREEMNLKNILVARSAVIEYECRNVIQSCLRRNLRAHVGYNFQKDEAVQVWQGSQWLGGYRFLARIHHNGVVGCGTRLAKIPLCNIRPLPSVSRDDEVIEGEEVIDLDPGSPSKAGDSKANVCVDRGSQPTIMDSLSVWYGSEESDELIFDAEFAHRFPKIVQRRGFPSMNQFGIQNPCSYSINAVIVSGINDKSFPDEEQDAFDPRRVPPRYYLRIKGAVESIKKELRDLTAVPKDGVPPLSLALKSDPKVKRLPWIRSTLVVRKKSSGVWKSRLCLRGDTVTLQTENFTSSPTTHRASLKLILSASRILHTSIYMMDVSMAFFAEPSPSGRRKMRCRSTRLRHSAVV